MTLSQRAIEAAARAMWPNFDNMPGAAKAEVLAEAERCLTAALAVDGLCLVQATELWPPFNVGDRVTHLSRQENGTVTAIEDGCVVVEFDRLAPKGQKSVGKYDAAWFRMYPRGLLAAANDGEELR